MMPPFFITGFQRSGTTLLRLMLDKHPQIAVPLDTTGLWLRYEERIKQYGSLEQDASLLSLIQDLLSEPRIALWGLQSSPTDILRRTTTRTWPDVMGAFYQTYADERGKSHWGDKDPGNMRRIHVIAKWFPDARFIQIIRDGRDACLSHQKQDFGHNLLLPCAAAWREEVWWVRALGSILGKDRYFELRYEDLIVEPEAHIRGVCAFLGVEYDPVMLRYHETVDQNIPNEKRHIWPLIDRPPQADNAAVWKRQMSDSVRICFEKRAGHLLADLGYETLTGPVSGAYLEELRQMAFAARQVVNTRLGRTRAARAGS